MLSKTKIHDAETLTADTTIYLHSDTPRKKLTVKS